MTRIRGKYSIIIIIILFLLHMRKRGIVIERMMTMCCRSYSSMTTTMSSSSSSSSSFVSSRRCRPLPLPHLLPRGGMSSSRARWASSSSSSSSSSGQSEAQSDNHAHPSKSSIKKAISKWLDQFIIAKNVCPFAKNVREETKIVVSEREHIEEVLEDFIKELREISTRDDDSNEEHDGVKTKTVLFAISPKCEFVRDFDSFLDFANIIDDAALQNGDTRGESVLDQLDLRGKVQVVSFHPDFIFAGEKLGDPGAFTNKAPYPLLHILREKDVTAAVKSHPDVKGIPKANVERMREIGNESLKKMLDGLRSL